MKSLAVGFIKDGKTYSFRDVATFDQFRNSIWAYLPNGINNWARWVQRNMTEKQLEDQFHLARGSFKGAYLIFGAEKIGRLLSAECRQIYLDSRSEGYVSIDLDRKEVRSRVILGDRQYVITYPLETALLSVETTIVDRYLEFIRGTDFQEEEGHFIV